MTKAKVLRLIMIPLVAVGIVAATSSVAEAAQYTRNNHCTIPLPPTKNTGTEYYNSTINDRAKSVKFHSSGNPVQSEHWDLKLISNGTQVGHWSGTKPIGNVNFDLNTPSSTDYARSSLHMHVLWDPFTGGSCSYDIGAL